MRAPSSRSVRLVIFVLLGLFPVLWLPRECRPEGMIGHTIAGINTTPEGELEYEMLLLTNQQRTQQGLKALAPDQTLVRIAREHSLGMAQQGFISHELPWGNLETRMSRGGYTFEVARENVASARTVLYAQNALMESPAHKRNILATDIDRVGIGIIRRPAPFEKELYITEIFASPREEYRPVAVQEQVLSRVHDLRQNGIGSLLPDPMLERLASDSVQSLNVPIQKEELRNLLAASAGKLQESGRTEIARVDASVQLLHDPKRLNIPAQTRNGEQARLFGTAVRQVVDGRNQPAFLVLTLIGFSN